MNNTTNPGFGKWVGDDDPADVAQANQVARASAPEVPDVIEQLQTLKSQDRQKILRQLPADQQRVVAALVSGQTLRELSQAQSQSVGALRALYGPAEASLERIFKSRVK